jgi:Holliday junction resolvase
MSGKGGLIAIRGTAGGIITTIDVARSKGKVVLKIGHTYRFGENVAMTPEQVSELVEKLKKALQ